MVMVGSPEAEMIDDDVVAKAKTSEGCALSMLWRARYCLDFCSSQQEGWISRGDAHHCDHGPWALLGVVKEGSEKLQRRGDFVGSCSGQMMDTFKLRCT